MVDIQENGSDREDIPRLLAGLIGTPVSHSLSPVMHNAAYAALGLPWHYTAYDIEDDDKARTFIEEVEEGFVGINVTMPYKRLALACATQRDGSAIRAGGANVLVFRGDCIDAYNTDGAGIVASLEQDGGLAAAGKSFLVCGTGPTAGAACGSLLDAGARHVVVMSRKRSSAEAFARTYDDERISGADYSQALEISGLSDGIVDATPIGMHPGDKSVLPPECFDARHVVLDMVYGHGETDIVTRAREAGARAIDGLGVLVAQAALTVEIWARLQLKRELTAPRDVMRHAALAELARREGSTWNT